MNLAFYKKSLLLALALVFGTQTVHASVFETYVKPVLDNKIAALATFMTVTTVVMTYTCYCLFKKLSHKNKKIGQKREKLNTKKNKLDATKALIGKDLLTELNVTKKELIVAHNLLAEIYEGYQNRKNQIQNTKGPDYTDTGFLNQPSGIYGLTNEEFSRLYLLLRENPTEA